MDINQKMPVIGKPYLFIDIDSTLIVNSKDDKYRNSEAYVVVGHKGGETMGYMSVENYKLLHYLRGYYTIIPVTSRNYQSYRSVNFGFEPEWALVENGARLVYGGKLVEGTSWGIESESNLKPYRDLYSALITIITDLGYIRKANSEHILDFYYPADGDYTPVQNKKREQLCDWLRWLSSTLSAMPIEVYISKNMHSILITYLKNKKSSGIHRLLKHIHKNLSSPYIYKILKQSYAAGDSEADWGMLGIVGESYGVGDSPATHNLSENEFNKDKESFTSFILTSLANKTLTSE